MAYNGGAKRLCTGSDLDIERSNGGSYIQGEPRRKRPDIPSRPNHILLYTIVNPAYPITVDVIHTISSPHGQVQRIVVFKKNGVQAMVEFECLESATRAKDALNGADIYSGCCTLKIEYAKPERLNVFKNDQDSWDFTAKEEVLPPQPRSAPLLQSPQYTGGRPQPYNASANQHSAGSPSGCGPGGRRLSDEHLQGSQHSCDSVSAQNDLEFGSGGPGPGHLMKEPGHRHHGPPHHHQHGFQDRLELPSRPPGFGDGGERYPHNNFLLKLKEQRMGMGKSGMLSPKFGPPPPFPGGVPPHHAPSHHAPPHHAPPHAPHHAPHHAPPMQQGPQQGAVMMVYGLDPQTANADRLFNLVCLYGNVVRIKFLKSKEGTAMVQMGDALALERCVQNLNNVTVGDNTLTLAFSKQAYLSEVMNPYPLPDKSPSYKDYVANKNNRFLTAASVHKNRIQPPSKIIHFFNTPPEVSEDQLLQVFQDYGVTAPLRLNKFPLKSVRSSSGLMEFTSTSQAVMAVMACNHATITHPGSKFPFLMKLCFSSARSIGSTSAGDKPNQDQDQDQDQDNDGGQDQDY